MGWCQMKAKTLSMSQVTLLLPLSNWQIKYDYIWPFQEYPYVLYKSNESLEIENT